MRQELTAQVRVVESTEPTAIPALVASGAASPALVAAFLAAAGDLATRALMEPLLLDRFVVPETGQYDSLHKRFEVMNAFWRSHPLAATIHPAFEW